MHFLKYLMLDSLTKDVHYYRDCIFNMMIGKQGVNEDDIRWSEIKSCAWKGVRTCLCPKQKEKKNSYYFEHLIQRDMSMLHSIC